MDAQTIALIRHCAQHAERIFVRVERGGRFRAESLATMPVSEALLWVARWAEEGRMPSRVGDDG